MSTMLLHHSRIVPVGLRKMEKFRQLTSLIYGIRYQSAKGMFCSRSHWLERFVAIRVNRVAPALEWFAISCSCTCVHRRFEKELEKKVSIALRFVDWFSAVHKA